MKGKLFSTSASTLGTLGDETNVKYDSPAFDVTETYVKISLSADQPMWTGNTPLIYTATINNTSPDEDYVLDTFSVGSFDNTIEYVPGSFKFGSTSVTEGVSMTSEFNIEAVFESGAATVSAGESVDVEFKVRLIAPTP